VADPTMGWQPIKEAKLKKKKAVHGKQDDLIISNGNLRQVTLTVECKNLL
jgi:hypothetical protein